MLDAGQSACSISASTGVYLFTISRLCFKERTELQKSTGGFQRSFPPPISVMPSALSPLKGQKMLSRSPNPSPASSISLSFPALFVFTLNKLIWKLWSRPNTLFSLPDCQGLSHGGSYMDKGTFCIRIRLPPCVVSGDCLALASCFWDCLLFACTWFNDLGDTEIVLVCRVCLWAPEGCFLLPTLSAYMVPCIPWWTTMFMIGGERQGLHLLMFCRPLYDTITDGHCTWIAVL